MNSLAELDHLDLNPAAKTQVAALIQALLNQTERDAKTIQAKDCHDWLIQTRVGTANGGAFAKALDYTLKRWPALIRYAKTGHLPIDNNPVENCIRPIALGKKNWLFTGSERAGIRAAAIQSLLGAAKLNGLNPALWLKETLEKLSTWPNSRIDELLPLAPEQIEAIKQKLLERTTWLR